MNVLSLFDGIACGRLALKRADVQVDNYFASEIDGNAIKVAMKNHNDIQQLGDVRTIVTGSLPHIHLVMGGSPCHGFSSAGLKKGLADERSGLLLQFVNLVRVLNPDYYLLENVTMSKDNEAAVNDIMGHEPHKINSALVSAQNRRRLYWTNIPVDDVIPDCGIRVRDILCADDDYCQFKSLRIGLTKRRTKNYVQWDKSGKGHNSQQDRGYYLDGKMCTVSRSGGLNKLNVCLDYDNNIYRRMHPIEVERLQNLPDGYTDGFGFSNSERIGLVGNGWTVDIIAHILRGMKGHEDASNSSCC